MNPETSPGPLELVATLGPASDSPGAVAALAGAGANLFRVNLAHAAPNWLDAVMRCVAENAGAAAGPLPVVADLPGCKPRTGDLDAPVRLRPGDRVWLGGPVPAGTEARRIPLDFAAIDCRPRIGDELRLRDGRIRLAVVRAAGDGCLCEVTVGGEAAGRMGVALAGEAGVRMHRSLPQDLLARCLRGGVRAFLISYCEEAADLAEVAEACRAQGVEGVRLIPKIETLRALDNLPAILEACDTLCAARGDLGTQVPLPELPGVERRLLAEARAAGRRAWVAGEVLGGFARAASASRGELAGVWSALDHGAAGFILSDETAVGPDPAGAVRLLRELVAAWSREQAI
jgi:pyruvate kinase